MRSSWTPISYSFGHVLRPDHHPVGPGVEVRLHHVAVGGLAVDGDGDGTGVAPDFRRHGVDPGAAFFHLGGGYAVGQPAVGVGHHAAQDVPGHAADDDRRVRVLGWLGERLDRREVVVLAVVLGLVLGPKLLHHLDGFSGLGPAMLKVAAHDLGLFPEPAGADAEHEAAPAEQVEAGNLLRQQQRVALRHQRNAGAQLDGAARSGGPGQSDVGVGEVGISPRNLASGGREGAVAVQGHGRVFGVPEGLEAQLLRLPGHEGRVDGIGGQGHGSSDAHWLTLLTVAGYPAMKEDVPSGEYTSPQELT